MAWLESRLMGLIAALGVAVMVFGFGYVMGARGQFQRGEAAGNAKVAKLTAEYATQSAQAAAAARDAQTKADAQALADAEHKAAAGTAATNHAQATAADTRQQLARQRTQINNEVRHDQTMAAWVGDELPAGVRGVLDDARH